MPSASGFLAGSQTYAADLAAFLDAHHPAGVLRGHGNELAVSSVTSDSGTIRLKVDTGMAMARGYYVRSYGDGTLVDLEAADASPRIDSIVARVDTSAPSFTITYHKGTPAASPVAPTLDDTATVREILIKSYRVNPGDTSSSSSAARYSGTPEWSTAPWEDDLAPKASPALTGIPTVDGKRVLDMGMTPRLSIVNIDQQGTEQAIAATSASPLMVLHSGFTIPSWATMARAIVTVTGLEALSEDSDWRMWLRVDGFAGLGADHLSRELNHTMFEGRNELTLQGAVSVPTALQGSSKALILQGYRTSSSGTIQRDTLTWATGQVQFYDESGL